MKKSNKKKLSKPRLFIFKSNKHIYAQIIDDKNNQILASSSTISNNIKQFANCEIAQKIGNNIGDQLNNQGINSIIFDCGKHKYHGQIKALAKGTREKGINF